MNLGHIEYWSSNINETVTTNHKTTLVLMTIIHYVNLDVTPLLNSIVLYYLQGPVCFVTIINSSNVCVCIPS